MAPPVTEAGRLYALADEFARRLAAADNATELRMLAMWSEAYWGVRQALDEFLGKVERARMAGEQPSPAWAYQQRRLQAVREQIVTEMARYAGGAARLTTVRQRDALAAAFGDAYALTEAAAGGLGGVDMARVNPAVLERFAGFMADGSPLASHLARTLPAEAVESVTSALVRGLALGRSQDWMTREATRALGLSHSRAVTIMRTESLRAYRAASRETYRANRDHLAGWTWVADLGPRCCVGCVAMHGTQHPVDAVLDGHPRCRCSMVPRTKTFAEMGLGDDIPETQPPAIETGEEWLVRQPAAIQEALMGRAKYRAWVNGEVSIQDMVARLSDPEWGTMRTERSLKAIRAGRHANFADTA